MQVTEPCVYLSLPYVRRARYRYSTFLRVRHSAAAAGLTQCQLSVHIGPLCSP